ncbi:zona pellucida-like domain-containing protein 1 [Gadus macrocephalus]|uniref:zona pellucida-like domain-containing protein 1 n=1 Tax=Gadus macrocephalus TaxID=80720 RepID=UPI0028CB1F97|nr:zona pellucida-like domain-containing protein 1 [Gadus macrocephalus]XP_059931453.1 zona pellucida-like domain-containing protein 1 [Gadus macrocephalus]
MGAMALISLLGLTSLFIAGHEALSLSECGPFGRRPEYTDISVVCGTSDIELAIQICPAIYTGYNESLLLLNLVNDNNTCSGTLDVWAVPPVLRFSFPIRDGNACGSNFQTTNSPGTGIFSDYSNTQNVNVSGIVQSFDPTIGTITYNAELKYYYSCAYPLEYLVNNTQVDVSASSVALKDKNGSFVSTLRMELFDDANYESPLIIPSLGVELRTKIYVQVVASNLTSQFHVFLDRCYASISPGPSDSTFFNLFVPCSIDPLTTMMENGDSQTARFSFSAFRFIEQQNETVSTYYLHCITRLCESAACSTFQTCNERRRRSVTTAVVQEGLTEPSLLTVPIKTKAEGTTTTKEEEHPSGQGQNGGSIGLGIAVGVLLLVGAAAMLTAATFYRRMRRLS